MQSLFNELRDLLKKDTRLVVEGELLKNQVTELALKLDKDLLKLLLSDKRIKEHFFVDVEGVLVFDKEKFTRFVNNKEFLPDSYTTFKNKIGLTVGENYLSENKEVVLSWAYKDTVLVGGQTKEESERDEIFWNEILAPDEIDRLLAPKVFTNWKRYSDKKQKKNDAEFQDIDNLIIKGNNLLALHSLKNRFAERVKLIYIDPPYNTGNDEFKYNDSFNQSTWLTFIKNRLEIAKELLSKDGAIFVSIDSNEIGYMLVLLDEVFGRENQQNIITVKRGSVTGHKTINPGVVNLAEYIVIYTKNKGLWNPNRVYRERERNVRYNNFILNRDKSISKWKFCSLLEAFAENVGVPKTQLKKKFGDAFEKEIFAFILKNADAVIQFAYPDEEKVSAEVQMLIKESNKHQDKVIHLERTNEPDIYLIAGQRILFYSDRLIEVEGEMVTGELISDIWIDVLPNDLHNEGGVKLKKGKKPEKLLQRIYELGSKPGDLVLDFYLGSGTSAAVAHKMGLRYIGVEQLEYGENDGVERLKNVIAGDTTGVSKGVNWNGGGSFVYCEIMQWNERFAQEILKTKKKEEIKAIWKEMQAKAHLSYKVDLAQFNENAKEFNDLSLEDQKRFLMEVLDKNALYVNLSEMEDKTYGVIEEDKRLNRLFYNF